MSRRNYSDKEKADALAVLKANGDNILRTSKDTGIPITTLWNWTRDRCGMNPDISIMGNDSKEELSNIFERVARKYLAHSESDLAVSSTYGNVAVMAAATATDKMQLLRGKPTEISGDESSTKTTLLTLIAFSAKEQGISESEVEKSFQRNYANKSHPLYNSELDPTVHPEVWKSGNLLNESADSEPEPTDAVS